MNPCSRSALYKRAGVVGLALTLGAILVACDQQQTEITPTGAEELMPSLAQRIALPTLESFADQTQEMDSAVQTLCADPDSGKLDAARDKWRTAYRGWRHVRPLMYGPAREQGIRRNLDEWPSHEVILQAITSAETQPDVREDRSVRGFSAVEYLLFDVPGHAVRPGMFNEPLYCAHLLDITGDIAERSARVRDAWQQGYAAELAASGAQGAEDAQTRRVLSLVVAELLNATDSLLWQRLGVPSGFFRGEPQPDKLEAWRSGETLAAIRATLEGMRDIVAGKDADSPGVAHLLAVKHPAEARKFVALMDELVQQAGQIQAPLHTSLVKDPDPTEDLFFKLQELKNQLLDNADLLGLSVQFEEDGD